jgi:hypothetical protein
MPRAGFDPASPTRKASILSILSFSLTGLYYRGPARGYRKRQLEVSGSLGGSSYPEKHHSPSSSDATCGSTRTPWREKTESLGR